MSASRQFARLADACARHPELHDVVTHFIFDGEFIRDGLVIVESRILDATPPTLSIGVVERASEALIHFVDAVCRGVVPDIAIPQTSNAQRYITAGADVTDGHFEIEITDWSPETDETAPSNLSVRMPTLYPGEQIATASADRRAVGADGAP